MINRAVLTGRLTKNVDLRYTPSGVAVANFTLAVDRNFVNKNGQRGTDFIRCVIWRKPAENFANFTTKGSLVGIDGQIRTNRYQNKQGETVYTTAIQVDNFALLESKQATDAKKQKQGINTQTQNQNQPNPMGNQPMNNGNNQPANNAPQGNQQGNNGNNQPVSNQPKQPVNANANGGNNNSNPQSSGKGPQGNKKIDISDNDLPF